MFNRKYLFDLLRNAPFGGTLSLAQVKAVEIILDICEGLKLPLVYIAYILATAFHETGGSFKPGRESLNYTSAALRSKFSRERISLADADRHGRNEKTGQKANQSAIANLIYGGSWGLRQLGNKLVGDGWKYIGRGFVQLTGRRNYELYGLADNPEGATDPDIAARILVKGMVNGSFTGKKLANYHMVGKADPDGRSIPVSFDAVGARAVVNGSDKASLIARHYDAILQALIKAEVQSRDVPANVKEDMKDTSEVVTADVPALESPVAKGVYSALGTGLAGTAIAAVTTPWAAIAFVALIAVGGVFLWGHLTGRFEFKRV